MNYRLALTITFTSTIVAGCGDDGGSKSPDAAPIASNIDVVTCDGSETATITAVAGTLAFMPNAATATVGQNVKFVMPSVHNVVPDPTNDANLKVNFSETKCLKFKAAGTYAFHCGPHNFKGAITVN